jgi:hypothetical protein
VTVASKTVDTPDRIDAERVLTLLTHQRDEYRALKSLADRQRALVTSSEPERLLTLLAERRRHVERLSGLNEEVKKLRLRWSDICSTMGDAQRRQADGLIHEVQTTLADILAGDERDARLLSVRMAGARRESIALAESKQACAAYGRAAVEASRAVPRAGGRFLDQTDEQA